MIIFLDFDGVLHPRAPAGKFFVHLPRLEGVLRDFPAVELVISSTWRESKTLDDLREIFSPDFRDRVIGTTPVLDVEYPPGPAGSREKEIREYLFQEPDANRPWLALDDEAPLFNSDLPNLILCNSRIGMDDEVEKQLRKYLLSQGMGENI